MRARPPTSTHPTPQQHAEWAAPRVQALPLTRPASGPEVRIPLWPPAPCVPFAGPQHRVSEVAVFHKLTLQRLCQRAGTVDVVFFKACPPRVCARRYTSIGAGCQKACKPARQDRSLSEEVTQLGCKVVRLSSRDLDVAQTLMTSARSKAPATPAGTGWVGVSVSLTLTPLARLCGRRAGPATSSAPARIHA
jgi:hypothetical protein